MPLPSYGKVRAPEFKPHLTWFNTAQPLSLQGLRGKIVLLDFWTYCCINCMHILPDLKKLEHEYSNQLVVIGVHSPKFENEKVDANVRQAMLRYTIEHPVVCDPDLSSWRQFGIRAWPTVALVDPEGYAVGLFPGEGNYHALKEAIEGLIELHRKKRTLRESPLSLGQESPPSSPLLFPGKVVADPRSELLFVSDSNHHRILMVTESGEILEQIGSGKPGRTDGNFSEASFFHPQGIALHQGSLFIADTENHLLRKVNLASKSVETLAGTGRQALYFNQEGEGEQTPLNSPWDLVCIDSYVYIAMAGFHQIWTYHLETTELRVFAGSGYENCIDGPLLRAALAQPSGLATDGEMLYVADSEVSAIRKIPLQREGEVTTLIGKDLFVFGDRDGKSSSALLQHPLGICLDGAKKRLFIADTYNHKIKALDLVTEEVETVWGGKGIFSEPSGIALRGDRLFIADTNHHRIVCYSLRTKEMKVIF